MVTLIAHSCSDIAYFVKNTLVYDILIVDKYLIDEKVYITPNYEGVWSIVNIAPHGLFIKSLSTSLAPQHMIIVI